MQTYKRFISIVLTVLTLCSLLSITASATNHTIKTGVGVVDVATGSNLRLRYAPEIVWSLDDSITYGARMLGLINSLGVKHDEDSDEE